MHFINNLLSFQWLSLFTNFLTFLQTFLYFQIIFFSIGQLGGRRSLRAIKVVMDCVREGPVHLLSGDTQEGQPRWIKGRMALLSLPAGYLIEFYSPPKVILLQYFVNYWVPIVFIIRVFRQTELL